MGRPVSGGAPVRVLCGGMVRSTGRENPVHRIGNLLAGFVAHSIVCKFPFGMDESLQNLFRADIDLGQTFDNLADLAGAETRPGKIWPVVGQIILGQGFQSAYGIGLFILTPTRCTKASTLICRAERP